MSSLLSLNPSSLKLGSLLTPTHWPGFCPCFLCRSVEHCPPNSTAAVSLDSRFCLLTWGPAPDSPWLLLLCAPLGRKLSRLEHSRGHLTVSCLSGMPAFTAWCPVSWKPCLTFFKNFYCYIVALGFPGGPRGRELAANAGDMRDAGSLSGWGRSLEEGMATHSSILAWRLPRTGEPGRLQSVHRSAKSQVKLKRLSTPTVALRCVLVSAVQQIESAVHTYIPSFLGFPPISRVPWAIQ